MAPENSFTMSRIPNPAVEQYGGMSDAWTFSNIQHHELSNPALTSEERKLLEFSTAQDVLGEVRLLESEHARQGHAKQYVRNVQTLLTGLEKFGGALDVFSNADSHGILSLVWGSIRLVIAVAKDFHDYLEEVFGFFAQIGGIFGRLQAYERIAPSSLRLNSALCAVFREFLLFLDCSRSLFSDATSRTSLRASFKSKIQNINPWSKFKEDARLRIKKLHTLCDEANFEATLAVNQRQEYHLENITAIVDSQAKISINSAHQETLKDFGRWLAPVSVNDDLDGIREGRMEGSCDWLAYDQVLKDWETSVYEGRTADPLWISGAPGTGKTHLSSFLVDHFRQYGCTVGYFFCKSEDQTKKSAISIIRTWAWQLFYPLQEVPQSLFKIYAKGGVPTKAALVECLIQLASSSISNVLIVDGLDECPVDDQVEILSVCQKLITKTKIVVVSRFELPIQTALQKFTAPRRLTQIRVTEDRNRQSIKKFILRGVDTLPVLIEAEQKSEVVDSLVKGACGVFLWVRLMLEHLSGQLFVEDVMEALAEAPQGLPGMYSRTLDSIDQMPPKRTQAAYRVLQWVLFALRPLSFEELHTALAIEPGGTTLRRLPNFQTLVLELCRGLVEIDQPSHTARLVHASVRDYLLSTTEIRRSKFCSVFDSSEANAYLAGACLTFLSLDRGYPLVEKERRFEGERVNHFLFSNPFMEYSSVAWVRHMAAVSKSVGSDQRPATFGLSPRSVVTWLQVIKVLDLARLPAIALTEELVDVLLTSNSGEDAGIPWISYASPMIALDALHTLRSHLGGIGGDQISRWRKFLCAGYLCGRSLPRIAVASYFDYLGIVREEVALGWSIDTHTNMGEDVFFLAARAGAMNVLEYMIKEKADVAHQHKPEQGDTATPNLLTALHCAVSDDLINWRGDRLWHTFAENSVPVLVNRSGNDRYLAAKSLLNAGADPMARDQAEDTVLHQMMRNLRDEQPEVDIAQALLDHGADLFSVNAAFQSPLHLTALRNTPRLARFFVKYTRAANSQSGREVEKLVNLRYTARIDSPLFIACAIKDSQVAPILLGEGADVKCRSNWNERSILSIAMAGARNTISQLLESGADPNAKDCNGNTALHDAARLNLGNEIKILVDHGSHINDVNSVGKTPLTIAIDHGNDGAIETLRDLGASVDSSKLDMASGVASESAISHGIKRYRTWLDHNPKETQDIFHAYFLLRCASRERCPRSVLREILELAQYWLRSSAHRKERMTFAQHNCKEPYLRSPPIVGRRHAPVQKIVFTITSKDQGWSDYTWDHGTTRGSHSWFEAWRLKRDDTTENTGKRIFNNIHAGQRFEQKIFVWSRIDGSDDEDSGRGAEWMTQLRPGDAVLVMALAGFVGWENIVQEAKVEVFTSILPIDSVSR